MASRSKEEPRSSFLFSQKSWQTNLLQIPQQVHYGEGGPFTRHSAYLSKNLSFRFPGKEALPQGPPYGIPCREMPHHYSLLSFFYQSPRYKNPPPKYQVPLRWKRTKWREMLVSLSPRPPPRIVFRDRCSIPRAPFMQLLKSPLDKPSYRFTNWVCYGKRYLSLEPFLHKLQGPQQGPSLQVPCT